MSKNVSFRQWGVGEQDLLLFLHTIRPPSRAEWDAVMSHLNTYAVSNDLRRLVVLAVSDGGGPDVMMRGQLMEFSKNHHHYFKTAAVSASRVIRGIAAAVSWFNPQIKAFAPDRLGAALAHLSLPQSAQPRILRELEEMERELEPSECLALMRKTQPAAEV